jgi:hypothetical protein
VAKPKSAPPQTASPTAAPTPLSVAEERGNSVGNIINLGWAAIQGDRIYYCNGSDGGKLYAIKTGGSGGQKLNNDKPYFINVVGDRI